MDGKKTHITYLEWKLLHYLLANPNKVLARRDIYREVWGEEPFGMELTLTTHISRLKAKTGLEITTIPYVGYRYDAEEYQPCPCCGRAMVGAVTPDTASVGK